LLLILPRMRPIDLQYFFIMLCLSRGG
jgi:hypothetical protein